MCWNNRQQIYAGLEKSLHPSTSRCSRYLKGHRKRLVNNANGTHLGCIFHCLHKNYVFLSENSKNNDNYRNRDREPNFILDKFLQIDTRYNKFSETHLKELYTSISTLAQ